MSDAATRLIRRHLTAMALVLTATIVPACDDDGGSRSKRETKAVPYESLNRVDGEIFMVLNADAEEIAGVARTLDRSRGVHKFGFLSREDAFREFRRLFAEKDPELVEHTDPEDLPVSFRVMLIEATDANAFRKVLDAKRGVDQVLLPD